MIKIIILVIANFFIVQNVFASFEQSHKLWSEVLQQYTDSKGFVRYQQLKTDIEQTNHPFLNYIKSLEKVKRNEYLNWDKKSKMAFLLNAYNAFTIKLILDYYPISSITDIGGVFWWLNKKPWKIKFFHLLDGEIQSLDPIENEYLRNDEFKDYRIHAALNCASLSCPQLRREAYFFEKLDQQLDEQMRSWLADSSKNKFDPSNKKIYLSKIFDWYHTDFEKWGGGIQVILDKFASEKMKLFSKNGYTIDYLEYDWGLNDAK